MRKGEEETGNETKGEGGKERRGDKDKRYQERAEERRDVQQLAFQYIAGFSKTAGRAVYYWFKNFIKRNPRLGMRKPEVLSAADFNRQVVSQWFEEYEKLLCTLCRHHCDESGL